MLKDEHESSYLAFSWRIDPEQPFFVKPAKEIFDERPDDVSRKEFDTVTSVTVSSSSSREFGGEMSSRLGVDRRLEAFVEAADASSASILPAEVRSLRVDNYIIAKQCLISTNLPDQSQRMKKSFKAFIREGTVKQIHDFMGDFYATEIALGGVFQMSTLLERGDRDKREELVMEVASEGAHLLQAAKAAWGRASSSPVKVAGREARTRLQVLGGEAMLWLQLEVGGQNEQKVQRQWAKSITRENAFPIEYRLSPLWQLFENEPDLKEKAQELKHYMIGEWKKSAAKVQPAASQPPAPDSHLVTRRVISSTTTTALRRSGPPSEVRLSRCGLWAVNGRYERRGSSSCKSGEDFCPMYARIGPGPKYLLYHYGPWDGLPQGWYIGKGMKSGSYFAPGDNSSPPTSGWHVFTGLLSHPGRAPPPTLSLQGRP